jgi:excisionase family DNA binding protein
MSTNGQIKVDRPKLAYTLRECADMLSCSVDLVRSMIFRKKIVAVRLSSRVLRIPATEIDRLLTGRKGPV